MGSSFNVWLTTGRPWKLEEKGAIEGEGAGARQEEGGGWEEGAGFRLLPASGPPQVSTNLSLRVSSRKRRSSLGTP